jgi:hypothetical protein
VNETTLVLADVRAALVAGVGATIRRRRRIRLAATICAAAALLGILVSGTAAGSGWLFGAPAPPRVAKDLRNFEQQTPPPHEQVARRSGVPLGKTVEVASGGGWQLYVLRTAAHDCYSVTPNGGDLCGPLSAASVPIQLLSYGVNADPRVKVDPSLAGRYGGGYVFGRTSVADAATVEIRVPGSTEPVTANVDPRTGYFIGAIGSTAGTPLLNDDNSAAHRTPLADWHAVVRNAAGSVIARSG